MLTILEGSTFCISDERGDIDGATRRAVREDTRRLSRFVLTINGQRPLLLSSGQVEYFSAAFYLRNPLAELPQDALSIARSRFVGDSMQERIVIRNESMETLRVRGRDRARLRLRGHLRGQGARLHARRSRAREAAAAAGDARLGERRRRSASSDGDDHDAGALLAAGSARRLARRLDGRAREPRAVGARGRGAAQGARGRAATAGRVRRRDRARARLARGVASARAAGERELGHARPGVPALGQRPRRAAHARRRRHRACCRPPACRGS